MQKKITVIYHGDCLDGFGGAWAAWKKLGKKARYIPGLTRDTLPKEAHGNDVLYLIDYTYKAHLIEKLLETNKHVIVLDHHVSAEREIKMTTDYRYDTKKSGATIAWEYFHPNEKMPRLLKYIEDGDLWRFAFKETNAVRAVLETEPATFIAHSAFAKRVEEAGARREVIRSGNLLLKYKEAFIREIQKNAEEVFFEGKKIYAVNSPVFESEIGHNMAKGRLCSIVWRKKKGETTASLRSDGKTDVSKIALKYGGGGHKAAAGFSIKDGTPLPWKPIKQ